MDIPNNYPPNSAGWHNIEAIKWWIQWEEIISRQGASGKTPEQFANDMMPESRDFLMAYTPAELGDILLHLEALRQGIVDLMPIIAGYTLIKSIDKGARGRELDALVNEIFANCGIPRVGEDFDP